MPKTSNTRQQKAEALKNAVLEGPSFFVPPKQVLTKEYAEALYELWANSFIVPALIELVPELRKEKKDA